MGLNNYRVWGIGQESRTPQGKIYVPSVEGIVKVKRTSITGEVSPQDVLLATLLVVGLRRSLRLG
jgi:hypothetical protein